jgi:hypothetical protein
MRCFLFPPVTERVCKIVTLLWFTLGFEQSLYALCKPMLFPVQ